MKLNPPEPIRSLSALAIPLLCAGPIPLNAASDCCLQPQTAERAAFEEAEAVSWKAVFTDPCTGDWKAQWFLDGEVGAVITGPDGMVLRAGPEFGNDAHHMVLWTQESFSGDLRIDYTYTRLDTETRAVNILYIEATGSGKAPFVKDISAWAEMRRIPSMRLYFDHMNAYHISYAAYPNDADITQYIRGRRYMPDQTGLTGSDLVPDYYPKGLFDTGVPHQITVIKKDRELLMRIKNPEQVFYCRMVNEALPPVTEGRVGLRHMFTRAARYRDITVSIPD